MKRKILLALVSTVSVVAPISVSASCGTSWQHWDKNTDQDTTNLKQDPSISNHPSFDPNKPKPVEKINDGPVVVPGDLWKVRDIADIKTDALEQATNTINLNKVNNQFELNALLIDMLGLKSPKNLDTYWQKSEWSNMADYIKNIKDKLDVKIKYTDKKGKDYTQTIKWDFEQAKKNILAGLTSGAPSKLPIEDNKAIYVSAAEDKLSQAGFNQAALVAADLMNVGIVNSLTSIDLNYAGYNLALLVNLPIPAFDSFKSMLEQMSQFTKALFDLNSNYKFTNSIIELWMSEKGLNPKLVINDLNNPAKYPKGLIEGAFLLQALSTKYDNLK